MSANQFGFWFEDQPKGPHLRIGDGAILVVGTPEVPEDHHFYFDESLAQGVLDAVTHDEPVLLIGPAGCGKSDMVRQIAKLACRELQTVCCDVDMTSEHVLGEQALEGGDTVFRPGPLLQAMKAGRWFLLEEISFCPADVLGALYTILDTRKHHVPGEEEPLEAAEGFHFFATCNPATFQYAGSKELSFALKDRHAIFRMDYMDPRRESLALRSYFELPERDIERMVQLAGRVRKLCLAQELSGDFTFRMLRRWARIARKFERNGRPDLERGFRAAVVPMFDASEDREAVEALFSQTMAPAPALPFNPLKR